MNNQPSELSTACWRAVYLIIVVMTVGLLGSHAQTIQPEMLFDFPYGSSPRGPEYPYGNLIHAGDGNFYGTTAGGGTYNVGTVFKVTTNGEVTTIASFSNTGNQFFRLKWP